MLSKGVMSKAEREAFRCGQRVILDELRGILAVGNPGASMHAIVGTYIRERLVEIRGEESRDESSVRA